MSICIVPLTDVEVNLIGSPTVKISLPSDYRSNFISDAKGRQALQSKTDRDWIKERLEVILQTGRGPLAEADYPMRSYGAGVLARVSATGLNDEPIIVLNIRGSNRGSVWPLGIAMVDLLGWKEFAGVTGVPEELLDPRITAIKELYEEVAFVSEMELLLPTDIGSYPDTKEQVELAVVRANTHCGFHLSPVSGSYPAVHPGDLKGDPGTTVQITDGLDESSFPAIVNYDPTTNALEISFVADITLHGRLTGILSLAGPENTDSKLRPYLEDVVVVTEGVLRRARLGQNVQVRHLLSAHGPNNLIHSPETLLRFCPAATLVPLTTFLDGTYSFRNVLATARDRL